MIVRNELDKSIDLKMRFSNGTDKTTVIPSSSSVTVDQVMQSTSKPADLDVYAVESGTNTIVYLNQLPELSVIPTLARNTMTIVASGDSGEYMYFLRHL